MRTSSSRISSTSSFIVRRISIGHRRVRIGEHAADLLDAEATALRDDDAELAAEAAQRVDARGAGGHPQRARAMQSLQSLLLDRLHAHRHDLGAARRFEQRAGIGGIGLVALDVGAHVGGRQQPHLDPETVQPARPVVRRATGFHDHQADGAIGEPALELGAREAMRFDDAPGAIGDGELEHRFREIHAHDGQSGGSIHVGLLRVER